MRPEGEFPHGDEWEKWVNLLLLTRYGDEGYQPIPAKVHGDAGLEGFAPPVGNAYQSYSPYLSFSTKERADGIKKKIRNDLNKLMSNGDQIKRLIGNNKIKSWILVVPKLEDKECISQLKKYESKALALKLDYIADDFTALIHDEHSYMAEIEQILKRSSSSIMIDHDYFSNEDLAELQKDNVSLGNLTRKCDIVYGSKSSSAKVNQHLRNAARKRNIIAHLKKFPEQYELCYKIKRSQEEKHDLFANKSQKSDLLLSTRLEDIERDFERVPALDVVSARTVCMGTLAEWLMDCHIDFE